MLNGMLSSFRPSKRLAEAPEPTSGAFSIMVCSQMANPENGTWLIRDAGSIDALIMGSRSASYSGRLTGLLASLRRAYLGTRAFVTSLRTSSGGFGRATRPQVRCRRESVSKAFFGNRASDRNSKSESGHPIGDPRIYPSGGPSERSVQMYTAGEVNLEPTPRRGIRRCRPRCRRPTSVRTACVTQLDRRRRDSDQCRLWVKLRRTQCEQMSSGLPLKADIALCSRHVSKVPILL